MDDNDKALEYYTKSLSIKQNELGENNSDLIPIYNNIGNVCNTEGNHDKAVEYYTKSLSIRIKTLGENHPDVATSYNKIGGVYKAKR